MKLIAQKRFEEIIGNLGKVDPILVVGDVGVDKYTQGDVNRISPEAPVTILEVEKEWHKLGLAANVTDNLHSLGVESTLCGVVGNDFNANVFENLLEEKQLSTWGVVRSENRPTILKERVTTKVQQICRIDYECKDPIDDQTQEKIKGRAKDFVKDHSCLIIEDYAKGVLSESLCQYLIKLFKDAGKLVAVDPGRVNAPQFYRGASLLKPNRAEAELMVFKLGLEEKRPQAMAQILAEKLNIDMVIITLGNEGMAIYNKGQFKIIPTTAKEVYDVSGAGDTAISAIVSALLAGAGLEEAAWIGNLASGIVVGKKGTATVTISELMKSYSDHIKTSSSSETVSRSLSASPTI